MLIQQIENQGLQIADSISQIVLLTVKQLCVSIEEIQIIKKLLLADVVLRSVLQNKEKEEGILESWSDQLDS